MQIKLQTEAPSRSRCFTRLDYSAMRPMPVMQIRDALRRGIARLDEASVPSGALSAELLLIHVLGRDRTWLYTHPEDVIPHDREEEYFRLISRRVAGEPAQYITGKQEFWGLDFEVTSAVLIPRPETEYLVEVALARIGAENRSESVRIADVGTGSGCIAVTLAKELPNAQILATDISAAALDVAQRNAARHNVANQIQFAEADLLELTCHRSPTHPSQLFDLIVSNPPYVANSDRDTLQREIREHEPEIALFGGPTGLEIYAHLIEQAESRLAQNGVLVVESGYGAAERIREMIEARSVWQDITVTNDLAGIPRVLAASFTGGPRRE